MGGANLKKKCNVNGLERDNRTRWKSDRHCRVINNSELISQSDNDVSNNGELNSRFTSCLCFSIYVTYNDLTQPYNDHYSDSQQRPTT